MNIKEMYESLNNASFKNNEKTKVIEKIKAIRASSIVGVIIFMFFACLSLVLAGLYSNSVADTISNEAAINLMDDYCKNQELGNYVYSKIGTDRAVITCEYGDIRILKGDNYGN